MCELTAGYSLQMPHPTRDGKGKTRELLTVLESISSLEVGGTCCRGAAGAARLLQAKGIPCFSLQTWTTVCPYLQAPFFFGKMSYNQVVNRNLPVLTESIRGPAGSTCTGSVIRAGKGSKPKRGKGKGTSKKEKKVVKVKEVDILSPDAMLNAYYVCHNAAACLELRGFLWPGSPKKKGKKRK
ncbi:small lysine-rich protein 1 isoform 1-T1 [Guaruba guarouba]